MAADRSRALTSPLVALLLWVAAGAEARSFRVSQIPNGSVNQCANCHLNPGGGGPRNSFGQAVEAGLIAGDVDWGAALAALDSDGDGFSNGQELQDPAGTWRPGQPSPGTASLVSRPGDAQSTAPAASSSSPPASSSGGTPATPAPAPVLEGPAATLDFGPVFLGESRTLPLSVANTGAAPAATQPIALFGRNYRELSLDEDRLSVPAGGTGTVQVTYTPTLLDSVAATLQLDFGFTFYETLVTGQGALRPPRLVLETSGLDFGLGRVGTPDTLSLWVSNAGQEALRVWQVESDTALFAAFPVAFEVAPGDTQQVFAVYRRPEPGNALDTLRIRSNDPTAAAAVLLAGSSAAPAISFSATALHFDDLPADQLPAAGDQVSRALVVFNTGILPLRVLAIAATDSAFAASPDSATLAPGDSLQVAVVYQPREARLDTAALVVLSDDLDHPEARIPLFGAAVAVEDPESQPPETPPVAGASPGDFNGDGRVDFADFFLFADHFGGADPLFDLDGGGRVDFADFFLFADHFGGAAAGE